jgi:hypothetical protein
MQDTGTKIENESSFGLDAAALEESLANAKTRFSKTDLSATPPIAPALSEQARELQQLKVQLHDSERLALRAQKTASDYREQLTEAQADIANMKSRWYAAEKARNAVSSQREVDSSGLNMQVIRLQKELERTQQLAGSDMERAATRIRTLEERLEKTLGNASRAETSQLLYRKRSNIFLALGISLSVIFASILIFGIPTQRSASRPAAPAMPVEALSQKPFVPKPPVKSLPDALGRLDKAFRSLPGLDHEAVIRQVRMRQSTPERPVCQFDWANGGPSMVFDRAGKEQSMENWAILISRCADAVDQSH